VATGTGAATDTGAATGTGAGLTDYTATVF